jgi:hypothetical protein
MRLSRVKWLARPGEEGRRFKDLHGVAAGSVQGAAQPDGTAGQLLLAEQA